MFAPRIKIDRDLHDRLARAAEAAGYATTDEFIVHILEQAVAGLDADATDDEVEKQLRGLGYLE